MPIDTLRKKLAIKRNRVKTRYIYYEQKDDRWYSINAVPTSLQVQFQAVSGWCTKAVDSLADRLNFGRFEDEQGDVFAVNDIFKRNNPDIFFDSAILSALISACCFAYISKQGDNISLQVIDGSNATGNINPITNLLDEGYAVLKRSTEGTPTLEAYFTPTETVYFDIENNKQWTDKTVASQLVPIIYKPDAKRPFGHSRISRSCMYLQDTAKRTMLRADVSGEFYSYPQKYLLGLSEDNATEDTFRMYMSTFLQITKDEDGDKPAIGQFQQQTMAPYIDQLKSIASMFAGECGLTLDDLGFSTDNPSSAEAIKAGHENLRLMATKAQRTFTSSFLNVAYTAAALRDDYAYSRDVFSDYKAIWHPIFEVTPSDMSGMGDAISKINQAIPEYFTEESLNTFLGR